jgi:hypothetical protein
LVVMGWTFRQSWTEGLLPVGLGLGEGLAERVLVGLGEGEAEVEVEGLVLGLAEALLLGVAEALSEAFGVALAVALALALALAVALLVALGVLVGVALLEALTLAVAFALALAVALALAEGDGELLDLVVFDLCFLGVLDDETEATSRTMAVWPAGTERAAEVVAGGWPHTLGAAALTVLASATVLPPRRPPMMVDETMAAPATTPSAEAPDRADFMAAPSSPWSSSLRPRVSSE